MRFISLISLRQGLRFKVYVDEHRMMVRSDLGIINLHASHPRSEHTPDKTVIQLPHLHRTTNQFFMGMKRVRRQAHTNRCISKTLVIGGASIIGGFASNPTIFRTARFGIEIAHPNSGERALWFSFTFGPFSVNLIVFVAPRADFKGAAVVVIKQEVNLFQSLPHPDMGKMDRKKTDRTARRADHAFKCCQCNPF